MLRELELTNFRCFSTHTVPFRPSTVIVGRNNAGKSTVVEALRIIGIATERYQGLSYHAPPEWIDDETRLRGASPSVEGLNITPEGVFHRYADPPARITAKFGDGHQLTVYVGPDLELFVTIKKPDGEFVESKGQAGRVELPLVNALPPLGPIVRHERLLTPETIRRGQSTELASTHFRNQIHLWKERFYTPFRERVEGSWPGLRVQEFRRQTTGDETQLHLLVRDEDFVGEVGEMGYGLKMWLQIVWFLTRSRNASVLVLDEPDVHVHPDLQRRLMRMIRSLPTQHIITTHSVELLSMAQPEDILVIDKRRSTSAFATSIDAVQTVVDRIGSAHNLQLSRLWHARKFLFLEGKDMKFLRRFHEVLFPEAEESFDALPYAPLGGWANWQYAAGSSLTLRNAAGDRITVYCVLDRDYRSPEEVDALVEEAAQKHVELHIWERKEIENYLLSPRAIVAALRRASLNPEAVPEEHRIREALERVCNDLRVETEDAISTHLQGTAGRTRLTAATANQQARARVAASWGTLEEKLRLVSGKSAVSRLSEWSQTTLNLSLSLPKISAALRPDDLPPEVFGVVRAIQTNSPFSRPPPMPARQAQLP